MGHLTSGYPGWIYLSLCGAVKFFLLWIDGQDLVLS